MLEQESTRYLPAAEILGMQDEEIQDVYVRQWRGTVPVRSLTGRERDAFEMSMTKEVPTRGGKTKQQRNMENLRARLIALTALNSDRKTRMFTGPEQVVALGAKNAAALNTLFEAACKLSGIGDKDIEEMVGNSGEEDGTPSSSDLLEI
jgi:hypothetical protein